MALGGLVSLSDRRLRLAGGRLAPVKAEGAPANEAPARPDPRRGRGASASARRRRRPGRAPARPRPGSPGPRARSARCAAWSARTSPSTTPRPTWPATCAQVVRDQSRRRDAATRRSRAFLTEPLRRVRAAQAAVHPGQRAALGRRPGFALVVGGVLMVLLLRRRTAPATPTVKTPRHFLRWKRRRLSGVVEGRMTRLRRRRRRKTISSVDA